MVEGYVFVAVAHDVLEPLEFERLQLGARHRFHARIEYHKASLP